MLDIIKALSAYRDPEALASILADKLGEFLPFSHLHVATFQENSPEVESLAWGKGALPVQSLSAEELRAGGSVRHWAPQSLSAGTSTTP